MGTYYVTRAVLPTMLERKSGDIVNVASTAGERGFATGSAYCASKFAVMGLTESLFHEVRKSNIRVVALTPSTVNTELAVRTGLPVSPEERMMHPEDVAHLTVAALTLPSRRIENRRHSHDQPAIITGIRRKGIPTGCPFAMSVLIRASCRSSYYSRPAVLFADGKISETPARRSPARTRHPHRPSGSSGRCSGLQFPVFSPGRPGSRNSLRRRTFR